MIAVHFKDLF